MKAIEIKRAVQNLLNTEPDGKIGSKSRAAFDALAQAPNDAPWPPASPASALVPPAGVLVGDGSWPWIKAHIGGNDILIEGAVVTAFGGSNDPMDSGETASGLSTKDNPSFLGCALPMRRDGNKELRGSPIPKIKWKTTVIFTDPVTGKSVETKLIDEGPARWTKHGGDLTVAAAKVFDPNATANNFEKRLNIQIVGALDNLA